MKDDHPQTLQDRVDSARAVDEELLRVVARELRRVFPEASVHPESVSDSCEAVLGLVDRCLPGWIITLRGEATEPDGHWHSTLRRAENDDDDAVIGIGSAPSVSLALLRALVSVARI